jgi:type I restriction enzyme S subunit
VLNQHIHRVVPRACVSKEYLYLLLREITEQVEKRAHGFKDTLVHLRKSELTRWPVALPSKEEQAAIVEAVGTITARESAERAKLDGLRTTKNVLAHALLTGEIRVTPAPEPT